MKVMSDRGFKELSVFLLISAQILPSENFIFTIFFSP